MIVLFFVFFPAPRIVCPLIEQWLGHNPNPNPNAATLIQMTWWKVASPNQKRPKKVDSGLPVVKTHLVSVKDQGNKWKKHLSSYLPPPHRLFPLLTQPALALQSPIAQSYLRLAISRMCRKDSGAANMYRCCWMIGRWRRSVPLEARSMASSIADKHLSTKTKKNQTKTTKNPKTIFEHEQNRRAAEHGARRRVRTL